MTFKSVPQDPRIHLRRLLLLLVRIVVLAVAVVQFTIVLAGQADVPGHELVECPIEAPEKRLVRLGAVMFVFTVAAMAVA